MGKTFFAFNIRNNKVGSIETVEVDVLELARHFDLVLPWIAGGKAWREDAVCWFRDLINTGTYDIVAEADVAKSIIETLIVSAPSPVVVSALTEWSARVEKNEDQTFDCVHALQLEDEEESLLHRTAEFLLKSHGFQQAVS